MSKVDKIAIFGGGGAYGACIVGWLSEVEPSYKVLAGTSTGALIAVLAAQRKYETLSDLYTDINNKEMHLDKFNNAKLIRKVMMGIIKGLFRKSGISKMGETLEKKIRDNYSEAEHEQLIKDGIKVYVTAHSSSHYPKDVEYFLNTECDYDTFIKAVVASASVPIIAETVEVRPGEFFWDGGISEGEPTAIANEYPDADIDLFLNYPRHTEIKTVKQRLFRLLPLVFRILFNTVRQDDLAPLKYRKNVHIVRPPYRLANSALDFNKRSMLNWHSMGAQQGRHYLRYQRGLG